MAENKKVCPHCGGTMFAAKIIRGCIVESDENNSFKILKENTEKYDIEVIKCGRCKEEVTNDSLVTGIPCKECGNIVNQSELSPEGLCVVCNAKKTNPDIENASYDDMVRMYLNLLKQNNELKNKQHPLVKTEPDSEEKSDSTSLVETENTEESEPVTTEEKPKKRVRRKKEVVDNQTPSEESVVENNQEEENTVETTESFSETIDNLANEQTAPFPDAIELNNLDGNMNPPASEQYQEESFGVDNFSMYDSESEESF